MENKTGESTTTEAAPPELEVIEPGSDATQIPDAFEPLPDGTTRVTFGGKVYMLRAPTIGQFEMLMGKLQGLVEGLSAEIDAADPQAGLTRLIANARGGYDFLAAAWGALEKHGIRLPPKDEVPAWLASGEVTSKLVVHWQTCPQVPGAS